MAARSPEKRIFCAIDTTDLDRARALAALAHGRIGGVKIGLEFFSAHGSGGVKSLSETGSAVFLDLKFHDIPNTVAAAVRAILPLRPAFITVHCAGGSAMLEAAVRAAEEAGSNGPKVLGVTVLTSLDSSDLKSLGISATVESQVGRLAAFAKECGLHGAVCSPHEIEAVRHVCGADFSLMVPGIRPKSADKSDQKRVMTPGEAIAKGADYLVIGRPITAARDPAQAMDAIISDLT